MELIINDQKFYVDKLDSESDKMFTERIEFIKEVYNDTKNIKDSINLSKIWLNFMYNDCRYQHDVYSKLKKYIKKDGTNNVLSI